MSINSFLRPQISVKRCTHETNGQSNSAKGRATAVYLDTYTLQRHMSHVHLTVPCDVGRGLDKVLWAHSSPLHEGISIGPAAFAQPARVPTTQTDRDHATCDTCRKRPRAMWWPNNTCNIHACADISLGTESD